ncbi:MAG TPA: BTAD domain-containing putative transcriptional regulator [Actinoplanes sp.]|jgi:predicted ATPase/DNA-binding SARP family transcriptional activator
MTVELTLLSRVGWRGEEITGSRLHGLLALLADDLRAGCSAGRLIEELWPDETPEHPAKALQTLVSRARARLGAGVIENTPTGYRLALDPERVDSSAVLLRAKEAERSAAAGDHAAALAAAEQGLAAFGGEGGREGPGAGPLSAAREPAYRALTRVRALSLARLGRAAEAVEPLTALAAEDPRDEETLLELLRCEAPAAALARYDTCRRALRDELGIDPGPALQALHRELLLNDAPLVRQGLRHEPNELLGRDGDLGAVTALLRTSKVVSIVGAGGLGKTRLAQAVGRQARQRLVYFVELAGVAGDVEAEVAANLGVAGVDGIVEALGAGLLVLDNCEHVIDATAELVRTLVERSAELRVLTTSRAPLGLSSESVYPLPELDLTTSVKLFVQRARAVRPADVAMTAAEDICRNLDGLPLAVELAAARIRTMSTIEIARRLDDRLGLLNGGHRDHAERHRTLHAVIDWSWHLLEPEARRAMRALSIFPGGFDAPTAARFTDDAVIAQLVDQSLLKVADTDVGTRFRMLETVREFSVARREEAGETPAVQNRFLGWAQDLGKQRFLLGDVELIRADEDNMALALRYGLDRHDGATVAAATALLGTLWLTDSKLTRLIALSAEAPGVLVRFRPPDDLVEATRTAAVWCALMSFLIRGPDPLRALATLRRLPPPDPATVIGAAQIAIAAADEVALRALCDDDRPLLAGIACYGYSYLAEYSNDPAVALEQARRMLPRFRNEDPWLRALAHARIGELCLQADPGEEAWRHIDAALSIMEELGAHSSAARARWALVLANLQRGALDQAEQALEQLAHGVLLEDAGPKMVELCTRAEIHLGRGDVEGGLALWRRAADGLRDDGGLWPSEVRAVAVLAHCRHGRLDQIGELAAALPAALSGLLPDAPAATFRICGVLLVALAAVAEDHGARAPAVRLLALAEGFGFSSTFGEPARFAESARRLDRPAYAAARAEFAGLDHDRLRAAALALLTPALLTPVPVTPTPVTPTPVTPAPVSDSGRDGTAAAPTDIPPPSAPGTTPPR